MTGNQAIELGLDWATQRIQSPANTAYPNYVSSASISPAQADYAAYTPATPMYNVKTPDYRFTGDLPGSYRGLMGQDYDAFQSALQAPGDISARSAYDTGLINLNNMYGGNGLYGSSIMLNQQREGLDRVLQETLAKNALQAAATRYATELEDLKAMNQYNLSRGALDLSREQDYNKFAQNMAQLNMTQAANEWNAGFQESQRKTIYDVAKQGYDLSQAQRMVDWQNMSAYEQYQYALAKQAFENQMREAGINEALALVGQGSPLSNAALNYAAQMANMQAENSRYSDASRVASQTGWLGAAGDMLGLLGSGNNLSTIGGWIGDFGGWLGGLLG